MNSLYINFRYNLPIQIIQFITSFLPDNRISVKIRGRLSRPFIKKCGKNFTIGRDVTLLNTYNLSIGDDVYIAKGCWLNAMGGLELEKEVVFGPYVVISTLQHTFKNNSVKQGASLASPVLIKEGSWIAAHCSVKCGVTIAKGNLIAANSFVANSTQDFKIYGGVPAKLIKNNSDNESGFTSRKNYISN